MGLKPYRTLALEIFKTLKVLNRTYIQDLFYLRFSFARRPNNIAVVRTNTNTYGRKSFRSLGPQIWNSLPDHIKAETSLAHFYLHILLILGFIKNASVTCISIPEHSMALTTK